MVTGIYGLRNLRNGKVYVGSGKCVMTRIRKHLRELRKGLHCNHHLQHSYNRGDTFQPMIIERCEESELISKEQYHIDLRKTCDNRFGYNLTIAGRTIPSEDGRRRISESKKGKTWEEIYGEEKAREIKEHYSRRFGGQNNPRYGTRGKEHPFYGKKMKDIVGEEVARKMTEATSKTMKGRKVSQETKDKISKARKGKKLSEAHKRAIGEGGRKNFEKTGNRTFEEKYGERAEEIKKKISNSLKGKKRPTPSKEWIEKMKSRRDPITGRLRKKAEL